MSPVETFPGDEAISTDTYESLMTGGYVAIIEYLKAGASSIDLTIDTVTEERWRRLISAAHYIDEFIDSASNRQVAGQLYETGLTAALGGDNLAESLEAMPQSHDSNRLLVPAVIALNNSIAGIRTERLEQLRQAALTIRDAAQQKATTSDISDYIDILAKESDATYSLLDGTADEQTTSQPEYSIFSDVIQKAMRISVYLDHSLDLKDDFEQDTTAVRPTVRHMGQLAVQAFTPARQAARRGDSLKMSWHMVKEIRPYIKPR